MNDSSLPQGTRPTLALSVTGLTKHYDSGFTLDDVTFDLPSGYIMGLVGPNGAGKSTLMKILAGYETLTGGELHIDGQAMHFGGSRAFEAQGIVMEPPVDMNA